PLGRTIYTVEDNKFIDRTTATVQEAFYATFISLDIAGNRLAVRDARGLTVMKVAYDMLDRNAATDSMDAGPRYLLPDGGGQALYAWDAKKNRFHTIYDALRRPLQHEVLTAAATTVVYAKAVYGTDPAKNQNGKLAESYDPAGSVTFDLYDFKGNVLSSTRSFAADYKGNIDWSNPALIPLDPQNFQTQARFDALN